MMQIFTIIDQADVFVICNNFCEETQQFQYKWRNNKLLKVHTIP